MALFDNHIRLSIGLPL